MQTSVLDGEALIRLLQGGVEKLRERKQEINDLNVFPVPDGDTGTNMVKTLEGGLDRLPAHAATAGEVAEAFAKGTLLGARGNSGVILSQYIAGVCSALVGQETLSPRQLAEAGKEGVRRAYAAVANPTEGTILTVFRESVDYVLAHLSEGGDFEELLALHVEEAERSLAKTKEILPVLAEADVVDSGGAGYLCIITGVYETLLGKAVTPRLEAKETEGQALDYDRFTADSVLTYGYCTECLVRLQNAKGDPESFDREGFLAALTELGGDSVVLLRDGDVLKLHVHIKTPGDVLALCQQYGEFLQVKIENMSLGHSGAEDTKKKKTARKKYVAVTVACGEGLAALFKDLGASAVIDGGQTANPSTEDFLTAFSQVNAEHILVLPNNGNVLLAAKQAAELYTESKVTVVPTKTLPQGYAALSVFQEAAESAEALASDMMDAASAVTSLEIGCAVRDAVIGGVEVKEGEYIGIVDGALLVSETTETEALLAAVSKVEDVEDKELLTLFVGEGVTEEERMKMVESLEEAFPELEVSAFVGGQKVYRYLVSLE
ncbi:MAG: DAK2 domain-containing protein [Clostridia bacterium]|nr:DAK2 domain-containing protein [Clostridia bacterium]